jgi:hypothetical protein
MCRQLLHTLTVGLIESRLALNAANKIQRIGVISVVIQGTGHQVHKFTFLFAMRACTSENRKVNFVTCKRTYLYSSEDASQVA